MGWAVSWLGQRFSSIEAFSVEGFAEGKYRRNDDRSGAELEKVDHVPIGKTLLFFTEIDFSVYSWEEALLFQRPEVFTKSPLRLANIPHSPHLYKSKPWELPLSSQPLGWVSRRLVHLPENQWSVPCEEMNPEKCRSSAAVECAGGCLRQDILLQWRALSRSYCQPHCQE